MSSYSGGPSCNPCPSGHDKWTQMESSYNLGETLAPGPSSLPFPLPSLCPEPSQDDICNNIAFQACQLDSLIHSIKGSSFSSADWPLEQLLGNLMAFFFPKVASMVTSFKHVLLYVLDVLKKYRGTGPDPPPALCIVPPHAPEVSAPPAAPTMPSGPWTCPQASLLAQAPPAPPSCSMPSFAEVAATPAKTPKSQNQLTYAKLAQNKALRPTSPCCAPMPLALILT
ncbi:hypothetical protein AX15_001748 [Amanita polypyramis BW_CC]|nr:hypothetical protein AX15_001748 [Amanita polypyramis BW_CC]